MNHKLLQYRGDASQKSSIAQQPQSPVELTLPQIQNDDKNENNMKKCHQSMKDLYAKSRLNGLLGHKRRKTVTQKSNKIAQPCITVWKGGSKCEFTKNLHSVAPNLKYTKQVQSIFEFGDLLGEGSSGRVYLARHIKMRYKCAVKLIPKKKIHRSIFLEKQLLNEFAALATLNHENILKVYELLHDDKFYIIVTELVKDGDLYEYFKRHFEVGYGPLQEWQIQSIAYQLLSCLEYIHESNVIHRDIKLENILVSEQDDGRLVVKIADFGMVGQEFDNQSKHHVGSLNYIAPEILDSRPASQKSDVWSACIVIYALFQAELPFNGETSDEVRNQIISTDMNDVLNSQIWTNYNYQVRDFLWQGLQTNPYNRMSASQLLNHPWLQGQNMEHKQILAATNNTRAPTDSTQDSPTHFSGVAFSRNSDASINKQEQEIQELLRRCEYQQSLSAQQLDILVSNVQDIKY